MIFTGFCLSIANNPVLELVLSPIFNLMPKYKFAVYAKPTKGNLKAAKNKMLQHHQNILDAISIKDENGAFEAMKAHLKETHDNYLKSTEIS